MNRRFKPSRFGDYVLTERIGAGGMAEIFLAEGPKSRQVVIKRILPTLSDDEQFVRMFIEEAKLCLALRHPNIVRVYDIGEHDHQYFIAMEHVDGRDLLKTLGACGKRKVGFPTDLALFIVSEILAGLHHAHGMRSSDGKALNIIHRDVSPSNVMMSFEGQVKLGDFGIAKARTREKTATGILKGKFGYMSPEQVIGATLDYRADVFAAGIILYELLTGHRLFAGKNDLAVLEQVRDARIQPPPRHYRPDLDSELEDIVLKALAKSPKNRFQTADDFRKSILNYVESVQARVRPTQLAGFMQSLFLDDPEERERRSRVRLPSAKGLNPAGEEFTSVQRSYVVEPDRSSEHTYDNDDATSNELEAPLDWASQFDPAEDTVGETQTQPPERRRAPITNRDDSDLSRTPAIQNVRSSTEPPLVRPVEDGPLVRLNTDEGHPYTTGSLEPVSQVSEPSLPMVAKGNGRIFSQNEEETDGLRPESDPTYRANNYSGDEPTIGLSRQAVVTATPDPAEQPASWISSTGSTESAAEHTHLGPLLEDPTVTPNGFKQSQRPQAYIEHDSTSGELISPDFQEESLPGARPLSREQALINDDITHLGNLASDSDMDELSKLPELFEPEKSENTKESPPALLDDIGRNGALETPSVRGPTNPLSAFGADRRSAHSDTPGRGWGGGGKAGPSVNAARFDAEREPSVTENELPPPTLGPPNSQDEVEALKRQQSVLRKAVRGARPARETNRAGRHIEAHDTQNRPKVSRLPKPSNRQATLSPPPSHTPDPRPTPSPISLEPTYHGRRWTGDYIFVALMVLGVAAILVLVSARIFSRPDTILRSEPARETISVEPAPATPEVKVVETADTAIERKNPPIASGTLTIRCPEPLELHIRRHGRFMVLAERNTEIPLPSGDHVVTMVREGRFVDRRAVRLEEGSSVDLACP